MQEEILERNTQANVRVYAIWVPILFRDAPSRWPDTALTDSRVTHIWDGEQKASRWFAEHQGFDHGPAAWDIYYLYGPDAQWASEPSPLVSSGYTIIDERDELMTNLFALLDDGG